MDPCKKDKNISNWELLNLAVGIIQKVFRTSDLKVQNRDDRFKTSNSKKYSLLKKNQIISCWYHEKSSDYDD